jgi:hypothetical protein
VRPEDFGFDGGTCRAAPRGDTSFRGGKAHDYGWLRALYLREGGARIPREIATHFSLVEM